MWLMWSLRLLLVAFLVAVITGAPIPPLVCGNRPSSYSVLRGVSETGALRFGTR